MLPASVRATLWSYDTKKISLEKNKELIVRQVLNFGDKKATDWLFKKTGKNEIKKIAQKIPRGSWNKKSLNYWSIILKIHPTDKFSK